MKTKLLSLFLILCFSMFGKPVNENRAKIVGLNFLQNKTNSNILKSATELQLTYKVNGTFENISEVRVLFYVFNVNSVGYVIVSGDDTVLPILGYSDQGNFVSTEMPSNIKKWLENYKKEITFVIENNIEANEEINNAWKTDLKSKSNNSNFTTTSVTPLIQTQWNQAPYYNALCPSSSVTGCVATAMAQIMKFWNYPTTGSGFHSYNHPQYGTLSANFGNTTYQWSSMPNAIYSPNNAIATLMFHCGVSVDMNYSPQSSGAAGATKVSPALNNYFGYQNTTISLRTNFTDVNWINLLKTELDQGRPMYYEGAGGGSGHAFVCDGYDNNNFFHYNWGWDGAYDGYFQVNALNPTGTGTGGGSGQYNSNQKIVKGIQPPTSAQNYNLALQNNVTPSSSIIGYGNAFTVSTNITNNGTNAFSGDYTIGVFDSSNNFVDYVETKLNYGNLPGGMTYTNNIVFSNSGLFSMLPGNYTLGFYYRTTGGNWKIVPNSGSFTNFTPITVVNTNPLKLNSSMVVSPSTTLIQGQSASVNLNILNSGTSTFTGQYKVCLYNLDGTFVQDFSSLNEVNGLQVGYTYSSPYLTFSTTSITANPGSYLIALQHKTTTGNWTLTGSTTNFINPIRVTVVEPSYLADIYENNNSVGQSYSLPMNLFISNVANISTAGSNCHIVTDNDYYKIILPSGYNYSIAPRLHDSYNSGNGNTYTLDALFSYSTDGTNWSSTIDDVISSNILVNNGGVIYFRTAPYFQGNIGTYLLSVAVTRTINLGLVENQLENNIKIYPNPAKDFLTIDCKDFNGELNELNLTNIQGQKVYSSNLINQSKTINLPVNNFSDGIYLLQVKTNNGNLTKKIIITK